MGSNAKRILGYCLVAFAVGSLGIMFGREMLQRDDGDEEFSIPPSAKIVVYYLSEGKDCTTCENMEAWTQKALETHFSAELESGNIVSYSFDMDQPQHKHFVTDYNLFTKSVVVAEMNNGEEVRWKNLSSVWDDIYDESAFIETIRRHVQEYLDGSP